MKFQFTTKTYVLLGIIFLNIAYVVYQVTLGSKSPSKQNIVLANEDFKIESVTTKNETFELLPIAKDPFLGTIKKRKKNSTLKKKTSKIKEQPWPDITYSGIVASMKNTSKVFILTINGQQVLLEKGGSFEDVKIISGTEQYLTIRFQGKTKKFEMQ